MQRTVIDSRLTASGQLEKREAAARFTRLRLIHFINRGNHTAVNPSSGKRYKIVMDCKTFFWSDHLTTAGEEIVRTSGKEWGFEVDPSGKIRKTPQG